jgi:hypothetical protein
MHNSDASAACSHNAASPPIRLPSWCFCELAAGPWVGPSGNCCALPPARGGRRQQPQLVLLVHPFAEKPCARLKAQVRKGVSRGELCSPQERCFSLLFQNPPPRGPSQQTNHPASRRQSTSCRRISSRRLLFPRAGGLPRRYAIYVARPPPLSPRGGISFAPPPRFLVENALLSTPRALVRGNRTASSRCPQPPPPRSHLHLLPMLVASPRCFLRRSPCAPAPRLAYSRNGRWSPL